MFILKNFTRIKYKFIFYVEIYTLVAVGHDTTYYNMIMIIISQKFFTDTQN